MIKKDFNIEFDNVEFAKERQKLYSQLVVSYDIQPFKYFLDICDKANYEFAILSAQRKPVIDVLLEKWSLSEKFNTIISVSNGDLTKREVLANVKEYYGYENNETVLFEDTNKNLKLAKDNEIAAIGIEHRYNKDMLLSADVIIRNEGIKDE